MNTQDILVEFSGIVKPRETEMMLNRSWNGTWRSGWSCMGIAVGVLCFAVHGHADQGPGFSSLVVGVGELAREATRSDITILDVRDAAAYADGHIAGAVHLPLQGTRLDRPPREMHSLLGSLGLRGPETVVLYGAEGDRRDLGWAFTLLHGAGVAAVHVLAAGSEEWEAAGGRIETGFEVPEATVFRPARPREPVASAEEVEASYGRAGVVLLDLRSDDTWRMYTPSRAFAAGHVPHALSYDFAILLPTGRAWPDPVEGRAELFELGPRPGSPVSPDSQFLLYGEGPSDRRVGLGYLLLRILGLEARIFAAGWQGWRAGDRPVVRIVTAQELRQVQQSTERSETGHYVRLPIFDLRELRDYEIGHLPGAYGLPSGQFPDLFDLAVEKFWPGADRSRDPLVLYCYGPDCIRSRDCATAAAREGWKELWWFRGGITGWFEAGFELESAVEVEN